MRKAKVFYGKLLAGEICELEDSYQFQYFPEYLESSVAKPISLTLPLQREGFKDKALFPFFDGLIPEGWLLEVAHQNWKINPNDRMGLLLSCCQETIGAVRVVEADDDA